VNVSPATSYVGGNVSLLPMLTVSGEAKTAAEAVAITRSASDAFRTYLSERQTKADIPDGQRVVVSVLNRATPPTVAEPRKKTIPLMVFVALLAATVGLALILENVRPRNRVVEPAPMTIPGERGKARARIAGVGRSNVRR
jgi:hypothetical protein